MLATRAADASAVAGYVNLVGGQDELVFDGGSMIFDHDGALLGVGPAVRGGVVVADLDIRARRTESGSSTPAARGGHAGARRLTPRHRAPPAEPRTGSVRRRRRRP